MYNNQRKIIFAYLSQAEVQIILGHPVILNINSGRHEQAGNQSGKQAKIKILSNFILEFSNKIIM